MNDEIKFIIISTYGELLDLAMCLSQDYEVLFQVTDSDYKKIGEGLVHKIDDWFEYLGQEYVWIIDGCETAKLQDWLRSRGEDVVGSCVALAEYEDDRQKGQAWFRKLGFKQPLSKNFKDFGDAIRYVQSSKTRLILKQNGSAPKHLNHKGKFDDGFDMIYHLEQLEKDWNESEYGPVDFDLMEIVEGTEIAASAFFNGHDWLRTRSGKVVGYLNAEQKKEMDGDLGETTGEMGTVFLGVDEDDELFRDIMLREGTAELLREHDFRGVFDINGCMTDKGFVAFEVTSRFGIPATSYEFMEGLDGNPAELIAAMAMGLDTPIDVKRDYGMVQVIAAKPFPVEEQVSRESTSLGARLWPLADGNRSEDFTKEQWRHIHLENFCKKDDAYLVATGNGYLLTVTQTGKSIEKVREKCLEFIKENLYIAGMKYRQDLGHNVEELL